MFHPRNPWAPFVSTSSLETNMDQSYSEARQTTRTSPTHQSIHRVYPEFFRRIGRTWGRERKDCHGIARTLMFYIFIQVFANAFYTNRISNRLSEVESSLGRASSSQASDIAQIKADLAQLKTDFATSQASQATSNVRVQELCAAVSI